MKNKGLIFSIDSLYGVIFVLVLAGMFGFYQIASDTDAYFVERLNFDTVDTAFVAFYLDKDPDFFESEGITDSLDETVNFSKCAILYDYPIEGDGISAQELINEKNFCKVL